VFLTLRITSSDQKREILTRKQERTLQTLGETNGLRTQLEMSLGKKGKRPPFELLLRYGEGWRRDKGAQKDRQ